MGAHRRCRKLSHDDPLTARSHDSHRRRVHYVPTVRKLWRARPMPVVPLQLVAVAAEPTGSSVKLTQRLSRRRVVPRLQPRRAAEIAAIGRVAINLFLVLTDSTVLPRLLCLLRRQ
jgi:hypothetical protein